MKTRFPLIAMACVLLPLAGTWLGLAQPKKEASTGEIMRLKLEYSQRILSGIATENFDLIALNAERLSQLSHAAAWRARETPQYELSSVEFRRHVDALAKAAKDRNLDAASLAYVQMTLSCVNCHKLMRGVKTAGARSSGLQEFAFRTADRR